MDYFGPYPHAAAGTNGANGMLGSVDEFSDWPCVQLTKHRTTQAWIDFVDLVIKQYRLRHVEIKFVLTDKSPELYQHNVGGDGLEHTQFQRSMHARNVMTLASKEYQWKSHGRIEVTWCHGEAIGRAMLIRPNTLNDSFFLWAMRHAIMMRRAMKRRSTGKTRELMFTGSPYDASQDKIFGAPGHAFLPSEKRANKGSPVSVACICVGFGDDMGWRVVYGTGATAKWADVTTATFYETGLISRGIMPKEAPGVTVATQTNESMSVCARAAGGNAVEAHAGDMPERRETPEMWRASLRTRHRPTALVAEQIATNASAYEWAVRMGGEADIAAATVMAFKDEQDACMLHDQAQLRAQTMMTDASAGAAVVPLRKQQMLQSFKGPQGMYQLIKPRSYNEAMRTPEAARWWKLMFEEVAALEAAGKFVPRHRSELPTGEKLHNGVWAFDHKKDMETLELIKPKVRPSFDGRAEDAVMAFSAPATIIEVLATIAVAIELRRCVAASDFGKAYTETKRPGEKSKWMRMMQGFVRYDADGVAMIYELPYNFWGERAGGRVFEEHKNACQQALGMLKAGDTVNVWTMPIDGGMLTSTNVVDDFLITCDDDQAMRAHKSGMESKFKEVKWRDYPTSFDGYKLTWVIAEDGRPISCTVSNPLKIMQLIELLGGIDEVKARAANKKATRELLEAATVPAEQLDSIGQRTQPGTGILQ